MALMLPKKMLVEELSRRVLAEGGFVDRPQGQFRVDATAWGILACYTSGTEQHVLENHRARLIHEQARTAGSG